MSERTDSGELEVRETFKVAAEFAPHVVVTEETFFGHGWQPLTTSVLMSLWFLPADASFDIPFLVDWFQRLGWKGANGKPLGAPVVRREIGLLREAGYVTVTRLRGESGKAVGIQYTVSQRRIDQPGSGDWIPVLPGTEEIRRSHHVRPMPTRGRSPQVGIEEKTSSDHTQAMPARGESPQVVNASKSQVAPRVANGVSPPHPPEEVTTSSPYPLTGTSGHTSLPSQEEGEEAGYTDKDLWAAADALQRLPDPWTQGKLNAGRLAPKLLAVMAEQGWPDIHSVDRAVLTQQLTKNPHKVTNPYRLLASDRIPNLPRYEVVAADVRKASGAAGMEMCPKHPQYRAGLRCIPCCTA